MRPTLIFAGLVLTLAVPGCADDREDMQSTGTGASASASSDGGEASDDGLGSTGLDEDTGGADGETGGDDADTGYDTTGTSGGGGDDGPPTEAPDCSKYWMGMYIPSTMYMSMKEPENAEEMFCYVNMERINYQFHGRNSGCTWSGGDGSTEVTWPYEMEFSADLTVSAQAAADAIAAGGQPPGMPIDGGFSNPTIYVDGCASAEYTVSARDDDGSALSNSNGSARMGVHYYDPGPNSPTLTKLGVGMSKTGNLYNWVVKFGG